uniref:Uncharacterized protein n=1 Tax=Papilio polytes TaxID=76194 RepID=I4DSE0_PAPPL|nr:unknown unsecreted protein [Papilio polytes]
MRCYTLNVPFLVATKERFLILMLFIFFFCIKCVSFSFPFHMICLHFLIISFIILFLVILNY